MILIKILSTARDTALRTIPKFLGFGKESYKTAGSGQTGPFGFDSNPPKGTTAVFSETGVRGEGVVLGYLNLDQMTDEGESRMYSEDEGILKGFIWLKKDGTYEFGGNTNHLAQFEALKTGFDELKSDFNDHLTAFNAHVHPTAASGPPSIPTPGTGIPATASTASIDSAKINEFKTL